MKLKPWKSLFHSFAKISCLTSYGIVKYNGRSTLASCKSCCFVHVRTFKYRSSHVDICSRTHCTNRVWARTIQVSTTLPTLHILISFYTGICCTWWRSLLRSQVSGRLYLLLWQLLNFFFQLFQLYTMSTTAWNHGT